MGCTAGGDLDGGGKLPFWDAIAECGRDINRTNHLRCLRAKRENRLRKKERAWVRLWRIIHSFMRAVF